MDNNDQVQIDPTLQEKAELLGIKYLPEIPEVSSELLEVISEEVAKKHRMVAFERVGNLVKLGLVDPENLETLNLLRFLSESKKLEFELYLIGDKAFNDALDRLSGGAEMAIEEAMKNLSGEEGVDDIFNEGDSEDEKNQEKSVQDAPVTKLLSVIIRHAIEGKASDIHIEPIDKKYRVRFRVDGVLHASLEIPKEVGRAVISRIKILSNLKIDEKRKPQDGRFRIVENGKQIDFRVSTFPVVEGEKTVLRVLDKNDKTLDLDDMGLKGTSREVLLDGIKEPYGIILITGPTGSGKSTTLYAFLQILNNEERNIVTLEDPVEYSIAGINQSQIKPEIDYTFASGLRSILRQDPNVIMVGEIRDSETAELSIHAALTGHLVLSTLHTNSSIGAIPRMIDMGIEPFLLSSSLQVVAAQRLVRRICGKCKKMTSVPKSVSKFVEQEVAKINQDELKKYGLDLSKGLKFYKGAGCEVCHNSGYKGRVAICEALRVDEELKEIIAEKNGSEPDILEHAHKKGMLFMQQDGILKCLLGETTIAEVERVTEGSLSVGGEVEDDRG